MTDLNEGFPRHVRVNPEGEQARHISEHPLYSIGDTVLCWINEGDLIQASIDRSINEAQAAQIDTLKRKLAVKDEALRPFAFYAVQFDRKRLRQLDDELMAIHVGTEWEASLRLSHCRAARAALEVSDEK